MATTSLPQSLSKQAARAADKQISAAQHHGQARPRAHWASAAGGNYYYTSPFRPQEKTPSFVVCAPKNVWADHGGTPQPGKKADGGDVLALIMRLTGFDLPRARLVLRAWAHDLATPAELALPPAGETFTEGKVTFTDVRVEPLSWKPLVEYLTWPGHQLGPGAAEPAHAQAHLQQIFYRNPNKPRDKPYFGLGWKTEAGWEVRSQNFQGTIGGKGLTWLLGRQRDEVVVFEGFLDYLSALTHFKRTGFRADRAHPQFGEYAHRGPAHAAGRRSCVHWFGDNDQAGERALWLLRQTLTPARVKAHNELYRGYKDVNDFLTKTPPVKPLPPKRAEPSQLSQTATYWLWVVFNERAPGTSEAAGKKRMCSFYSWTNNAEGLEYLRVLRNRLGDQIGYYRLVRAHPRPPVQDFRMGRPLPAPTRAAPCD